MNKHDFRELVDRRLSEFNWDASRQQDVLRAMDEEEKPMKKKLSAAVVLAIAAILVLSATALAAAYHEGFFHNAFGKGVEGQEAHDLVLEGEGEGLDKSEHYPAVERVDVDEAAEALAGPYVADIGESVQLEDYTFTLESALLDENGIGALTVRVENPNGHGIQADPNAYTEESPEPFLCSITRSEAPEGYWDFMDDRASLVRDDFTDTQATFVYYLTPLSPLSADEPLTVSFILNTPEQDFADRPQASLTIPGGNRLPARAFVGEKTTALVSPVGITLRYAFGDGEEKIEHSLVLRYADGGEYVVKGDDLANFAVASVYEDFGTAWFAFNRLANVESLAEISVSGTVSGDPFDCTLTPQD